MPSAQEKRNKKKGAALKKRREQFGLTQPQLAARLGVHPITLSRFERGAEPITTLVDLALCELWRRLAAKEEGAKK